MSDDKRIGELEHELAAVRELMNCYNLGGWTDANAAMKRALAAEAALAERTKERDALLREIDLLRASVSPSNLRDLGEFLANLLDEDRWPAAERWLNAALSERASLIAERDAAIRQEDASFRRAEEDAARLDWIEKAFFERHWSGTLGEPSYWTMAGPFRHTLQRMRGKNLRDAIDAARAEEEK